VLAGALAPLASGQQTFTVTAGSFDLEQGVSVNAFMPQTVTVNVGDTVTWKIDGFHTVTVTGTSAPPTLIVEDPDDPSRYLFNFAGVGIPIGGDSFDGTNLVSSGVPPAPEPAPAGESGTPAGDEEALPAPYLYTLTFTRPGAFTYVCAVHPQMAGTVVVLASGDLPHTADEVAAAAAEEIPGYVASVVSKNAELQDSGAQSIQVGVRGDMAENIRFAPSDVTIVAGETVTWTTETDEPHTVTFLDEAHTVSLLSGVNPIVDTIVEEQPNGPPKLVVSPTLLEPLGADTYTHDGIASSGLLTPFGEFYGIGERPDSYSLTFTEPGTYEYYCIIHGQDMVGSVTVLAADELEAPSEAAEDPTDVAAEESTDAALEEPSDVPSEELAPTEEATEVPTEESAEEAAADQPEPRQLVPSGLPDTGDGSSEQGGTIDPISLLAPWW
jgi:plastocyanin